MSKKTSQMGILSKISRRRGSAAIEFAFMAPLMVVLAAAVIDFAWYINRFYNIQQVTRDSARIAATVYESDADAGVASVQAALDHSETVFTGLGLDDNLATTDVTYDNGEFRTITVAVTYPHTAMTGGLLNILSVLAGEGNVSPLPDEIFSTFTMAVEIQ